MDTGNYEQISLPHTDLESQLPFMQPSSEVMLLLVDGRPSAVDLPASVELAVVETEPGVKGDTVSNVTKPATLETGRGRPGAALRERRRPHQGRHARGALHLAGLAVPALVDTSIRLLSQEPLAQRMQSSRVLELAEILDTAGFAYLEVSGGGCFDSAVRRGVESPWERIRAIRSRCSTPLGMALRGRLLVGSRPLSRDLVSQLRGQRGRERHRHLPDPRPAERPCESPGGGRGDPRSGEGACRRARAQPGPGRRHGRLARAGQSPRGARRLARPHPRPVGVARSCQGTRARRARRRGERAARRPALPGSRRRGAGRRRSRRPGRAQG